MVGVLVQLWKQAKETVIRKSTFLQSCTPFKASKESVRGALANNKDRICVTAIEVEDVHVHLEPGQRGELLCVY